MHHFSVRKTSPAKSGILQNGASCHLDRNALGKRLRSDSVCIADVPVTRSQRSNPTIPSRTQAFADNSIQRQTPTALPPTDRSRLVRSVRTHVRTLPSSRDRPRNARPEPPRTGRNSHIFSAFPGRKRRGRVLYKRCERALRYVHPEHSPDVFRRNRATLSGLCANRRASCAHGAGHRSPRLV